MSQLSDLLDFVKSRMPDGTSFSEIQGYLEIEDKVEVRNLINDALNKCYLAKTGEKRGTRYLAADGAKNHPVDDEDDDPPITNKGLEVYLNDATPIHDAVIVHTENIIKFKKPTNLKEFIQNGTKIISYLICYHKEKQKNVVAEVTEIIRMNRFVIKVADREPIIEKYDEVSGKSEIMTFPSYEELREELRLQLH